MLQPVSFLPLHQAHDPRALMARWRLLARAAGLQVRTLVTMEGEPVLCLQSRRAEPAPLVYLSAGVHGDEVGAAWGLLFWAEKHLEKLRAGRFLIFPCLNPHGLRANTRLDQRGLDINRRFHLPEDPLSGPWSRLIAENPPALGLCLHEDYDAQGSYVYELSREQPPVSEKILQHCTRRIPRDLRRRIDGRPAKEGIIRRSTIPPDLPGMPEAIVLWQLGCPITLTFETPSEICLQHRIHAQVSFIEAALRFALPSSAQPA